jgi:hypothetical protein
MFVVTGGEEDRRIPKERRTLVLRECWIVLAARLRASWALLVHPSAENMAHSQKSHGTAGMVLDHVKSLRLLVVWLT